MCRIIIKNTNFYFRLFLILLVGLAITCMLTDCTNKNLGSNSLSKKENPLDWVNRTYSINCYGLPVRFEEAVGFNIYSYNLTLVLLDCSAMDNMGPNEVQVYSYNKNNNSVSLLQTILSSSDNWVITSFLQVSPTGKVSLPVAGYSSNSVSKISPNIRTVLTWNWDGTRFRESSIEPIHMLLNA